MGLLHGVLKTCRGAPEWGSDENEQVGGQVTGKDGLQGASMLSRAKLHSPRTQDADSNSMRPLPSTSTTLTHGSLVEGDVQRIADPIGQN